MKNCRVVIADDHKMVREGLKLILAKRTDFEVVGEAADGLELLRLLQKGEETDIVILDISMPRLRGIKAIREIKQLRPRIKVLVLTMHKEEDLLSHALECGADGYLLKEEVIKELFPALDAIAGGKSYISSPLVREAKEG